MNALSFLRDARAPAAVLLASALAFARELARGGYPSSALFFVAASGLWLLAARHGSALMDRRPALAVFLASLAAYLSTFRWHGGDDVTNSLIPFAIFSHGTLTLDPVADPLLTGKLNDFTVPARDGRLLSIYPITPAILALPLYVVPALAGAAPAESFVHSLSKAGGALITAASVALFYGSLEGSGRRWRLALTALYGLGSWSWSLASQALWQAGAAQLGLALALFGLVRSSARGAFWAGFGLGLAAASRPDHAFFAAAGLGYALFHRREALLPGAAGAAVPLGLTLAYWVAYTGVPLPPEWAVQTTLFPGFQPEALAGLLASPQRGIPLYFPAVFFGLWAAARRPDPRKLWLLGAAAALVALICFRTNWVGGLSFGPRYFSGVALVLAWFCAELEEPVTRSPALTRLWTAAVGASVLTHAIGAYFSWPGHGWHTELTVATLWDWRLHPIPHLFSAAGPLHRLPDAGRWLIGASFLGAAAALAALAARWLRPAGGPADGRRA